MIEPGQHIACKKIAFIGMGIAGEDEGFEAEGTIGLDLPQHLIGITDNGGAATGPGPANARPQIIFHKAFIIRLAAHFGLTADTERGGVERLLPDFLAGRIPALGELIDRIGGEQVRNMGTIGGNIANGSPIGDTPPPLIALDATLTLRKGRQRRTILLEDFFIAYGRQDRQPGEFVEAVHVPLPAAHEKFAVYKVTKRRDEDITAVLGAFRLALGDDGTVASVRIAYGGMAATPKRAPAVEAALVGRPWTQASVEAAMAACEADFSPLTDMRATAGYRALVARNLLLRFFLETTGTPGPLGVSRYEVA